jgi:hypothetical protein
MSCLSCVQHRLALTALLAWRDRYREQTLLRDAMATAGEPAQSALADISLFCW